VISASGIPEFEFNLALATEVKESLEKSGMQVRMIGDKGDLIFLNHRTRRARGADLFLSIHHDSMRESVIATRRDQLAGFSLFVSRRNPDPAKSLACASAIGARLRAAGLTPSRYHADPVIGENRPFADEQNGVHYYDNLAVAHTATMPAVLVEAGVIANRQDEARMRDPQVRRQVAAAIAGGARDCLP
jgi:N-acetylmuramoyl-L-alanine amidase